MAATSPSTADSTPDLNLACRVITEIQSVLALMRQNTKWAVVPHFVDETDLDEPLLTSFKTLRKSLLSGPLPGGPSQYLTPFLDVIRSEGTNPPITGAALSAVHKFLSTELFDASTPGAREAIQSIVQAVTSCRFEVSDLASEEIVLMKILQVLLSCLRCSAGALLSDRDVCNVVNSCFRIVHQSVARGELLQRASCNTMQEMIRTIFGKLPNLPAPVAEEDLIDCVDTLVLLEGDVDKTEGESRDEVPEGSDLETSDEEEETGSGAEVSIGGPTVLIHEAAVQLAALHARQKQSLQTPNPKTVLEAPADAPPALPAGNPPEPSPSAPPLGPNPGVVPHGPHGVACMVEIFHFLCSLLSLDDSLAASVQQGAIGEEDMPLFALGLINSAIELGGAAMADHPKLLSLLQDDLFRNLMQLGLSPNTLVSSQVCGIVLNLYLSLRAHLKLQLEAFFSIVVVRLAQGRYGAPYQQQEVILETLLDFARLPGFVADAYANFDCDVSCSNVLQDLTALLSRSAFPVNSPLSVLHVLALDSLLSIVHQIEARLPCHPPGPPPPAPVPSPDDLLNFWTFRPECLLPQGQDPVSQDGDLLSSQVAGGSSQAVGASSQVPEDSSQVPQNSSQLATNSSQVSSNSSQLSPNSSQVAARDSFQAATDPETTLARLDFVRKRKAVKRQLALGVEQFNRDPEKGIQFLQESGLLPRESDPRGVASFFRYTPGLNKVVVGEYLGDHHEFNVAVLEHFTALFDFQEMSIDAALRSFLEHFRLSGEAQKIARVMEAFAGRYYEQCHDVLANKDAAFILSYSVIMLNTDRHNGQVKKKMTLEEFIRNNSRINDNADLPAEMLSDIFHSIVRNEIRISADSSSAGPEMTFSLWLNLLRSSVGPTFVPFLDLSPSPHALDFDIFCSLNGPTIAALSVVFDHTEEDHVLQPCLRAFLAISRVAAHFRLHETLDDLIVSLCRFTTLLNPWTTYDEPSLAFGEDVKARLATATVFAIANKHGNYLRASWRNVLDCVLRLHNLALLPAKVVGDVAPDDVAATGGDGVESLRGPATTLPNPPVPRRRPSGLVSRVSQFLSLETEDPKSEPTAEEVSAHRRTLKTIEECHVELLFTDSRFLQTEALLGLVGALVRAGGRPQRGGSSSAEEEESACFCLELLVVVTLTNRDRIAVLWPTVSEHLAGIMQGATTATPLVEKAVFGLLRICRRLLPYKEEVAEELLRSLQLVQKLDAQVAYVLCEKITGKVLQLVRANAAHIKSPTGWKTVCSLIGITARHQEASEIGFQGLTFIMTEGSHVTPSNYIPCLDAAREFAESRVGGDDRSAWALDLLTGLLANLQTWSQATKRSPAGDSAAVQDLADMWLRLAQAIRKLAGDPRESVRNHAVVCLQRCIVGLDDMQLPVPFWGKIFDQIVFVLVDDVLDIAVKEKPKDFPGMDGTLHLSLKLLSKVFLHFLPQLMDLPEPGFRALWLAVLSRMDIVINARLRGVATERMLEIVPELLKNILLVMAAKGALVEEKTEKGDSLWELTWQQVQGIAPGLKGEVFPEERQEVGPVVQVAP